MWTYSPPTSPWLDLIHVDRDIVVLNKPSGLLSVPGRDPSTADSALSRVLERHPTALIVHRLDMDTSGLLVLALRKKAEAALRDQFQRRTVAKEYIARVWGHLADDEGVIDLPLRIEEGQPRSVVDLERGKPARTLYRVLSRDPDGTSRLSLIPVTGRSHQLRVHLLSLGHPILGDRFYAPEAALRAADRLCLHAAAISIDHPYRGERSRFEAPAAF